jgi:hypothetical protein
MNCHSELLSISETVQDYFEGMHFRDIDRLRKAFHPTACLYGYRNGEFTYLQLEQWLGRLESRPTPADVGECFDMKIVATDVTGQVASVKVRDLYRGLWFTDYLSLLKIENRWAIVNKTFHHD